MASLSTCHLELVVRDGNLVKSLVKSLVILSSKSLIYIKIIKVLIFTLAVPHSKLLSSLKPPNLLQHAVFCQSTIFLSSRLCHPRYHGLLIYIVIFDVALCQKLSENLSR